MTPATNEPATNERAMTAAETTLDAEIRSATARLADAGIASAHVDAVTLAAHVLGCDEGEVRRRMVMRSATDADFRPAFGELVRERESRIPLQHLTGVAHFRRLTVRVGPGVFIPRPETELVAQAVIDALAEIEDPVVVDLGTGSGAIALAVKDEAPHAQVIAVELDPLAHGWAVANRDHTGIDVDVVLGDATTALPDLLGGVDIVVSNPPYIPTDMEPVDPEVRDHDPQLALYGGSSDGLAIPLRIAARAALLLRPGGLLVMEHADSHGQSLPARLRTTRDWTDIVDHPDLSGRPRFVTARRNTSAPDPGGAGADDDPNVAGQRM